jgi:RNA polymerase sigma factor (sigma-70 family)
MAELGTVAPEDGADSAALELLESRDELWIALRRLTPRQRAVLVLRYFHDLSEAQVAETLGCTTATVSSTASRSLTHLRDLIEPAPLQTRKDQR